MKDEYCYGSPAANSVLAGFGVGLVTLDSFICFKVL
jgi:hypothetical protein